MSDRLYHLQREYGAQDPEWIEVAKRHLNMSESQAKKAHIREQYKQALGLWQTRDSQKAPWLVNLKKLASYLDGRERKRA